MIRITIEMLPKGDEQKGRLLGRAIIANDASGTETRGNYRCTIFKLGTTAIWKTSAVANFPRKKFGCWDLLLACLVAAIGDRLAALKGART